MKNTPQQSMTLPFIDIWDTEHFPEDGSKVQRIQPLSYAPPPPVPPPSASAGHFRVGPLHRSLTISRRLLSKAVITR